MGQNRGGGGEEKICLDAAIVRLANAIHWIDEGSAGVMLDANI